MHTDIFLRYQPCSIISARISSIYQSRHGGLFVSSTFTYNGPAPLMWVPIPPAARTIIFALVSHRLTMSFRTSRRALFHQLNFMLVSSVLLPRFQDYYGSCLCRLHVFSATFFSFTRVSQVTGIAASYSSVAALVNGLALCGAIHTYRDMACISLFSCQSLNIMMNRWCRHDLFKGYDSVRKI